MATASVQQLLGHDESRLAVAMRSIKQPAAPRSSKSAHLGVMMSNGLLRFASCNKP